MQQEHITDAAIANIASKTTYLGAGATGWGWLLSSEGVALVGLILAFAGFLVNWYYRHKQDRRDAEAHDVRMRDLKDDQ